MKYDLVGVAGTFGSGKDTIAHDLSDNYGFTHASTSDLVREAAMAERGSIERPVLREVADHHRRTDGPGYFVELAMRKPRPLVVSGIRSLGEMKALKGAGGIMIYVDAPIELRYQRMISRARDDEAKVTLEEFIAREEKEMHGGDSDADFNIRRIGELADYRLSNDGSLKDFLDAAHEVMGIGEDDK